MRRLFSPATLLVVVFSAAFSFLVLGGCSMLSKELDTSADTNAHFQYRENIELTDDLMRVADDIGYGTQEGEDSLESLEAAGTLSETAYWSLVPALEAEQYLETKYTGLDFRVVDCYTAYNGQTNTYQQGKTVKLELLRTVVIGPCPQEATR